MKSLTSLVLSLVTVAFAAPSFADGFGGLGEHAKKGTKFGATGVKKGMGAKEQAKAKRTKAQRQRGKQNKEAGQFKSSVAAMNKLGNTNKASNKRLDKHRKAGAKQWKGGQKTVNKANKAKAAQRKRVGKRFGGTKKRR